MALVVGLDIGLDGGVAVLDLTTARVISTSIMPRTLTAHGKHVVDAVALKKLLPASACLTVIEFTHSFGHESRSSCFSFGRSTGKTQAVLELMGMAYEEVTPQMWKAEILEGTKKDKAAAIGYCKARWPKHDIGKHDGIADSLCMAEFARRRVLGTTK